MPSTCFALVHVVGQAQAAPDDGDAVHSGDEDAEQHHQCTPAVRLVEGAHGGRLVGDLLGLGQRRALGGRAAACGVASSSMGSAAGAGVAAAGAAAGAGVAGAAGAAGVGAGVTAAGVTTESSEQTGVTVGGTTGAAEIVSVAGT